MYTIGLSSFISRILRILYHLGFWDTKDGKFSFECGPKLFHYLCMFLFFTSLLTGSYLSNDNDDSIFLLAVAVGNFVQSFRVCKLMLGKNSILAFLQDFSSHLTNDSEEFARIKKKLRIFTKISLWFLILILVGVFCAMIFPLISNEKSLLLKIAFPLDWKTNLFSFWAAYIFEMSGIMYAALSLFFSTIVCYLMLNCTIKYEILGNQLKNLGRIKADEKSEAKPKKMSKKEKQELYMEDLIEATKTHQNIDRMVDKFAQYFEDAFFLQISTSGLCICGSIYTMIFMTSYNVADLVVYCLFIIYSFFDIFVVMFLADKITESSSRLSYSLFESDWIEQSQRTKKCVVIMAEVLKKPKEIVVCKLYPLNLVTFTSILHGAYSMFNILQNLK